MKKYSILLAITALIIASLACQTLMGGGDSGDDTQVQPLPPLDNSGSGDSPTEESTDIILGESPFPVTSDAFNIISTNETVTYQTNLSSDEIIKFYQDEFGKLGYTEDSTISTNFSGLFTLGFDGHESGRKIVIAGAPFGDGSTSVTIAFQ